jgi:hypothetical protein
MKSSVRIVLADNLRHLMSTRPDLDSQPKIEAACGVRQRTVSNLLNPDRDDVKHGPRLDVVEIVASAFGLSTWQLLVDRSEVGQETADWLMRPNFPQQPRKKP